MITRHTFKMEVVVDGDFECDVAQAIKTTLEGETIATRLVESEPLPVIIDEVTLDRGGTKSRTSRMALRLGRLLLEWSGIEADEDLAEAFVDAVPQSSIPEAAGVIADSLRRACRHEDQYVNDRSQFVCRDCGEELGR